MRIQNVQQNTYGKQNNKNQNTYNQSFRGFAGNDILDILAKRETELTPQIIKRLTDSIKNLPDNVGVNMVHTSVPNGGYDLYLRDTNYPQAFSKSSNRRMKQPGNIWRSYTDNPDYDPKPSSVKKPETMHKLIETICNMLENPTEVQKALSDVRKNQKERIATRVEYAKLKKYTQKHLKKINSISISDSPFGNDNTLTKKIESSHEAFLNCEDEAFVRPNFTDNLDKILSLPTKQYKYKFVEGQSMYFEITNSITAKTAYVEITMLNENINIGMPPKKFAEEFEKLLKEIDTPEKPEVAAEELLPPPTPAQNTTIEEQSPSILTWLKNWHNRNFDKETRLKLEKASQLAAKRENVKTINEQLQTLIQDETLVAKANKLNLVNSNGKPIDLTEWIKAKSEEATKTLSHDISINFPQNFRYVLDSDLNEKNLIQQWNIEDTKYEQICLEKKLAFEQNTYQPTVNSSPILNLSKKPEEFKKDFDSIQREFFAKIAERETTHNEVLAFQQLVK